MEKTMQNRRDFMKMCLGGATLGGLGLASSSLAINACMAKPRPRIANRKPQKALVVWYSQTGHTGRIGRVICREWEKAGLKVDGTDYRQCDPASVGRYELIALGTPVHYMDAPANFKNWIKTLPRLDNASAAAFATFGGKGDGQHNTACRLLDLAADRGAAPAGMGLFSNMSTFAPTWSLGSQDRILAYRSLPNEATYKQARGFANATLAKVAAGQDFAIDYDFGMASLAPASLQRGLTKVLITDHHIDKAACIQCGTCVQKCPAGAINLEKGTVDSGPCLACLGCVNNCPVSAMKMRFLGKPVYGFKEFLRRNHIEIQEPVERI